jgi:hypothetical protein
MIYLLPEEAKYLLRVLKTQTSWWIKDSLIDKIEYDQSTKKARGECEHVFHEYAGEKQCCAKCGLMEEGMCVEWRIGKAIDPEEYKMPKFLPRPTLFEPSPTG